MKAVVQTGPESVEVQEVDRPTPGPKEALVEVHTAGLCGSDAHAYLYEGGYQWIPIPRIMGHEYSGTVVEVGDEVESFDPGDMIVEEPIHHCGECFQCCNGQENVCQNFSITGMHRDGAWTEYILVEPQHLHAIPEDVSLKNAAITEPMSIATRAVFDQSEVRSGNNVLVQGPGPIGTLTAAVADTMGANVLVSGLEQDSESRLPHVDEIGDIETLDVETEDLDERADAFTDSIGFDVVFDATGHRTGVETSADVVRKGGQIVVVGIPGEASELLMTPLVRGEIEVNTSYGSLWRNFEQALRLMDNGAVRPETVIDRTYPVSSASKAIEGFLNSETVKPVFKFNGV